jgi:hypothetical protein
VQQLLTVVVSSLDVVSLPVLPWMLALLDSLLLGPDDAVPRRLLTQVRLMSDTHGPRDPPTF